jgi:two-component system OmpR family response regulator
MPSNAFYRLLYVDDDEEACEMLSLLLKPYGIEITGARSAADAWPKIKTERFDLYMLDGWLPKLNGFDLCRQIRESDSLTPIIFYSGAGYEADKRMGFAAGANAYVTKPDIEGLIESTRELLAKARTEPVASRSVSEACPLVEHGVSSQLLFGVASAGS